MLGLASEAATVSTAGDRASVGGKATDNTAADTPFESESSRFILDEDGLLLLEILGGLNPGNAADVFWFWLMGCRDRSFSLFRSLCSMYAARKKMSLNQDLFYVTNPTWTFIFVVPDVCFETDRTTTCYTFALADPHLGSTIQQLGTMVIAANVSRHCCI